jgi:hypothetical protein
MKKSCVLLTSAAFCLGWLSSSALAQQACSPNNGAVPQGSNTTDRSAPFLIDTTGLDLSNAPPTRDPGNPNFVKATELPDGTLPPPGAEGNFIIGPTHNPAPETVAQDGIPHGKLYSFTISSSESAIYNPGVIRDDPPNCRNGSVNSAPTAPGDRSNMIVTTSHPGVWQRTIDVYVPAQFAAGRAAPFIVFGDGGATGSYPAETCSTRSTASSHSTASRRSSRSASRQAARTRKAANAAENTMRCPAPTRSGSSERSCRSLKRTRARS